MKLNLKDKWEWILQSFSAHSFVPMGINYLFALSMWDTFILSNARTTCDEIFIGATSQAGRQVSFRVQGQQPGYQTIPIGLETFTCALERPLKESISTPPGGGSGARGASVLSLSPSNDWSIKSFGNLFKKYHQ